MKIPQIDKTLNLSGVFLLLSCLNNNLQSKTSFWIIVNGIEIDDYKFRISFYCSQDDWFTSLSKLENEIQQNLSKLDSATLTTYSNRTNNELLILQNLKDNQTIFLKDKDRETSIILLSNFGLDINKFSFENSKQLTKKIKFVKLINSSESFVEMIANNGRKHQNKVTQIEGFVCESKDTIKQIDLFEKEMRERDHRYIGKQLNIFTTNAQSGQGFTFWLEDGFLLKSKIKSYIRTQEHLLGFSEVQTPAFGSIALYERSGHLNHYKETMFNSIELDSNEKIMPRPMSCPHHILLYESTNRSYRDLPIRISEHAQLYRYEKSGALIGLERVRSMELTDAHLFVREDQIKSELKMCYFLIEKVLKKFDIQIDHVALSFRNYEENTKFHQNKTLWSKSEQILKEVTDDLKVKYVIEEGEAAFYGPKMDIQVKTHLGHIVTLSTLQLDFLLPEKFNLVYVNSDNELKRPVIIHRGLIGTYERFVSILLEQTKGVFPFWLAPKQAIIIPIDVSNKDQLNRSWEIRNKLVKLGYSVFVDESTDRLSKKVRNAQISKAKFQIIIGNDELNNKTLNLRSYNDVKTRKVTLEALIEEFEILCQD